MFYKLTLITLLLTSQLYAQVDKGTEKEIAIGPYLQKMTSKSATICWSSLEGVSTLTDSSGNTVEIPEYRQHEMRLAGLQGKSKYSYDVLGDGSAEGSGFFTTFPNKIEPFRFVAFGDTRSRHDIHQKIVNRIIRQKPHQGHTDRCFPTSRFTHKA